MNIGAIGSLGRGSSGPGCTVCSVTTTAGVVVVGSAVALGFLVKSRNFVFDTLAACCSPASLTTPSPDCFSRMAKLNFTDVTQCCDALPAVLDDKTGDVAGVSVLLGLSGLVVLAVAGIVIYNRCKSRGGYSSLV